MPTPSSLGRSARLTSRGRVTIPLEVRRVLGLQPPDRVAFVVEGNEVRLRHAESVVARTAGALKQYFPQPPLSAEAERDLYQELVAQDVLRRMQS
jgi:antitoxin PrlF